MAAVYRDEEGRFLGASALVIHGLTEPDILEAAACREGLSLADDLNLQRVHIACDSKSVVDGISKLNKGPYSSIIREVEQRRTMFDQVLIRHEKREFNDEAHRLVKAASSLPLGRHVFYEPPTCTHIPLIIQ